MEYSLMYIDQGSAELFLPLTNQLKLLENGGTNLLSRQLMVRNNKGLLCSICLSE